MDAFDKDIAERIARKNDPNNLILRDQVGPFTVSTRRYEGAKGEYYQTYIIGRPAHDMYDEVCEGKLKAKAQHAIAIAEATSDWLIGG